MSKVVLSFAKPKKQQSTEDWKNSYSADDDADDPAWDFCVFCGKPNERK